MPNPNSNPFLLAADNSPDLLPLLRSNPALASGQDDHGYSLVHAAASYNHLDLLRALIREFGVSVDLRDEDGETALFVVETIEAAKVLVEELGADVGIRGSEGFTAGEKIEVEGDYPAIAEYLKSRQGGSAGPAAGAGASAGAEVGTMPPLPEGVNVTVGTMNEETDIPQEVNMELRRRIEELSQRDDFHSDEGQAELRRLVEEALLGDRA